MSVTHHSIMKKYLFPMFFAMAALLQSCNGPDQTPADVEHEIEVVGQDHYTVGYEGEVISVEIKANCKWNISKTDANGEGLSWIQTDVATGEGSKSFRINVQANNTTEARSGVINIYSDQVTAYIDIEQEAGPETDPENPGTENPDPENPDPENPGTEPTSITLEFNFLNPDALTGWPTEEKSQTDPAAQITLPYVLDGVTYNFISSRPLNVTSLGWAYNRGDGLFNPKQCYLGFPVVEGYALTTVHYTIGANNGANYMITGAIAEGTADPVPVGGGETQSDSSATEFTFNLTDTVPGTQYWIKVWSKPSIMTSMTLTYSK